MCKYFLIDTAFLVVQKTETICITVVVSGTGLADGVGGNRGVHLPGVGLRSPVWWRDDESLAVLLRRHLLRLHPCLGTSQGEYRRSASTTFSLKHVRVCVLYCTIMDVYRCQHVNLAQ